MKPRSHGQRVGLLAREIGRVLGLPPEALRTLAVGGVFHDVGKLFLPRSVLGKRGPLSAEEWGLVRRHPVWGAWVLSAWEGGLGPVSSVALYHHERWDGTGYPFGLRGEEIPLLARVVAVADAYDAMVSDRPYRRGKPPEIALREIRNLAGVQFDPEVVQAFLSLWKEEEVWRRTFS